MASSRARRRCRPTVDANPLRAALIFFAVYVAVAATSFPGAAILTLVGGAIFGFWTGLLLVSFASSVGATLAFLSARFLLRDFVQGKFGDRLKPINEGVDKDGAFYLFALRLVPLFPFFVVNLLMGLTPSAPGRSTGSASSACWPAPRCTSTPAPSWRSSIR